MRLRNTFFALLLALPALPATAGAAGAVTFTGGPAEGSWVKTRDVTVGFTGGTECAVDAGAFGGCANTFTATGLADGAHSISVRDSVTTVARSFKVDATAPVADLSGNPAVVKPTPGTEPIYLAGGNVHFSATDDHLASVECGIDGAAYAPCQSAFSEGYRCLANGGHTFHLRVSDQAGNVSEATHAWTQSGWAENPTCPPPAPEPEPDLSDIASSDGGPAVTLTGGVASGAWSTSRDVSLGFTTAGGTVACAVDDGAFGPCSAADQHTATDLPDGVHSISVRATDAAGKQSTAGRRFRVDATAPVANLGSFPAEGHTYVADLSSGMYWYSGWVAFLPEDAHLATKQCRWDDETFRACSDSNGERYDCLPNGPHRFQLRLTDRAGNVTVASRSFTLQGYAVYPGCPPRAPEPEPDLSDLASSDGGPAVTLTGGVASGAWSRSRDVTLEFTTAGERVECAVDDGAFGPCSAAGQHTASALTDGVHSISVRAYDAAGKQSTAGRRFRVDATAPLVSLGPWPSEGGVVAPSPGTAGGGGIYLAGGELTFVPEEAHLATTECRFDDAGFSPCESANWQSFHCLPMGRHTFHLRLTDKAGNVTEATRTFTSQGWIPNPHCAQDIKQDPHPPVKIPDLVDPPEPPVQPTPVVKAASLPHLAVSAQHTRTWTRLRSIRVLGAPPGAKVTVTCVGGGCPSRAHTTRALRVADVTGRRLKPGARVTVTVAAHKLTIKIRANRAPLVT